MVTQQFSPLTYQYLPACKNNRSNNQQQRYKAKRKISRKNTPDKKVITPGQLLYNINLHTQAAEAPIENANREQTSLKSTNPLLYCIHNQSPKGRAAFLHCMGFRAYSFATPGIQPDGTPLHFTQPLSCSTNKQEKQKTTPAKITNKHTHLKYEIYSSILLKAQHSPLNNTKKKIKQRKYHYKWKSNK